MPKTEEYQSESDAWNVAKGYVNHKILLPLVECDKLIRIAMFGSEFIEQSIMIEPSVKTYFRLESIKRLINELKILVENTNAFLRKNGLETMEELTQCIEAVEEVLPGIEKETTDAVNHNITIQINEQHFNLVLGYLRDIKEEIVKPLNQSNLIFPSSDEFDLDKLKEQLIFGG